MFTRTLRVALVSSAVVAAPLHAQRSAFADSLTSWISRDVVLRNEIRWKALTKDDRTGIVTLVLGRLRRDAGSIKPLPGPVDSLFGFWEFVDPLDGGNDFAAGCASRAGIANGDSAISWNATVGIVGQLNSICSLLGSAVTQRAKSRPALEIFHRLGDSLVSVHGGPQQSTSPASCLGRSAALIAEADIVSARVVQRLNSVLTRLCKSMVAAVAPPTERVAIFDESFAMESARNAQLEGQIEGLEATILNLAYQLHCAKTPSDCENDVASFQPRVTLPDPYWPIPGLPIAPLSVAGDWCPIDRTHRFGPLESPLGGLVVAESRGAIGVGVVGHVAGLAILGSMRIGGSATTGSFELGVGPTSGRLAYVQLFGTVQYRGDTGKFGVGIFVLPYTFGRLGFGAGVGTTGLVTIATRIQ